MKYLFGPIKSRRLGMSLGVDVVPYKTCTFDCIYCEVGKTTNKICERKSFFDVKEILKELDEFLKDYNGKIDYITLAGSGEPLLNKDIGIIINYIKEKYPYNVALITNSALLYRDDVIKDIENLDVVLPSLDTLVNTTYLKLNRPVKNITLEKILEGLYNLKNISVKIFLETLFVKGYNDREEEILKFKEFIPKYKPDEWQLNTVVRIPAYDFAKPVSYYFLKFVKDFVGYENTNIYYYPKEEYIKVNMDIEKYILNTVKRRPLDLKEILSLFDEKQVYLAINKLRSQGKIEVTGNLQIVRKEL